MSGRRHLSVIFKTVECAAPVIFYPIVESAVKRGKIALVSAHKNAGALLFKDPFQYQSGVKGERAFEQTHGIFIVFVYKIKKLLFYRGIFPIRAKMPGIQRYPISAQWQGVFFFYYRFPVGDHQQTVFFVFAQAAGAFVFKKSGLVF